MRKQKHENKKDNLRCSLPFIYQFWYTIQNMEKGGSVFYV